ncbi:MAG: hypothetical protein FJ312_01750 [SAR202 cluster bacterium]|nr:hypothetical protein [SAR202 cluster bacterium]
MAQYTAYFNGQWIPADEMKLDRRDRGFRTADVVFDAMRTYDGKLFKLDRHMDRFYRSLHYARIDPGLTKEEMAAIVEGTVGRNRHLLAEEGDFQVYMFVTRGRGMWAHIAGPPTIGVEAYQLPFHRYAPFMDGGASGVIAKTRSYSHQSVDPKIKHQARMNFNLAELEAKDVDPDAFPILLDMEGNLTEGTINSVFLVTNGTIRTPTDESILQSISRSVVMDLAKQLGIPLVEEPLQPYDLYTSDEAFMAFTGPGVLPMTRVDKQPIGDGKPGPITNQLLAAWSEMTGVDIATQAKRFARG